MSALTKLSAVRLEEALILQTECAGCRHTLKQHPLTTSGTRCVHHDVRRGQLVYCKCSAFLDAADQLALGVKE